MNCSARSPREPGSPLAGGNQLPACREGHIIKATHTIPLYFVWLSTFPTKNEGQITEAYAHPHPTSPHPKRYVQVGEGLLVWVTAAGMGSPVD